MTNRADAQLDEAIGLAMQAEREAEEFYAKAAEVAGDPRGRDMFLKLARFERHHYESLRRLRESGPERDPEEYAGLSLLPEAPATSGETPAPARQTDLDAIETALRSERRARQAYLDLAGRAAAPPVRRMFERLADEEGLHEKVLQDQFLALANRGHWTWGE